MKKRIFAFILAVCLMAAFSGCSFGISHVTLGNVLVLGDSYSAFEGHIPEGFAAYYGEKSKDIGVNSHKKMWWHRLITRTDSKLLLNSSYSGSTLCNTGYGGDDYSEISFSARLDKLIEYGFFEKNTVDTVVILGGLNDYWASSPLGEIKYDDITKNDIYNVYPAFSYMLSRISEASPETRIIYIAEEYLPADMKACLCEICEHYGADIVEIHGISKEGGHPDGDGMKAIAEQVIEYLENKE